MDKGDHVMLHSTIPESIHITQNEREDFFCNEIDSLKQTMIEAGQTCDWQILIDLDNKCRDLVETINQHSLSVDGRYRIKVKMDTLLIAYREVLVILQSKQQRLDEELLRLGDEKERVTLSCRLH
jgi:hypothetical protein